MSKPNDGEPHDEPDYRLRDEDRAWLARRMEERRMSGAALGRAVGLSRQAVYQLKDGTIRRTTKWNAIVAALGGTPPSGVPPITDPRLVAIVNRWPEYSPADKKLLEEMARRLGSKKP